MRYLDRLSTAYIHLLISQGKIKLEDVITYYHNEWWDEDPMGDGQEPKCHP